MSVIVEAESYEQRRERLLSWADHHPKYIDRYTQWNDPIKNNVVVMMEKPEGNYRVRDWQLNSNIVTNDGDVYYAIRGAAGTPAANEGASRMELANPGTPVTPAKGHTYTNMTTPITTSRQTFDTGYPKANDDDVNNPGRGTKVISYRRTWDGPSFAANGIVNGSIHDHASPVGTTKLVALFVISPAKNKTNTDSMTVWVNHSMLGA